MFGGPGLQDGAARSVRPPRPARRLGQQLEGPLCGPKVATAQAEIGINHTDEGQKGEIMALGCRLGGDENVDLAVGHPLDQGAGGPGIGGGVGAEHRRPRLGEQLADLFLDPFDPGADRDQTVDRAAGRTVFRPRHGEAGQVADQPAGVAMLDQPAVGVGCRHPVTAGATKNHRRIAAPVQEQQGLFTAQQRLADGLAQGLGQPGLGIRRTGPEVQQGHFRQDRRPVPRRQLKPAVAALLRVPQGFQRRGGRGQHHCGPLDPGPRHRQVAAMIDQPLPLFERTVVLLVHDQQPQVDEGQEQGRPRPDHDIAAARAYRFPDLSAAGRGDAGVPFGGGSTEPGGDPGDQILGQGDLGQQDQDLGRRIGPQRPRRGLQIGLGLARAGDAVEQEGGKAALARRRRDRGRRRRLVRIERGRGMIRMGRIEGGDRLDLDDLQHALVQQAFDHAGGHPRRPRQIGARHGAVTQCLQNRHARCRQLGGRPVPDPSHAPLGPGPGGTQPLQRRRRHLPRRTQGPAGGPFDEIHGAFGQPRLVQNMVDGLQLPV